MKILAIETSCDDTAIAILEVEESKNFPAFNVLSNIVSSQIEVHKKYGGVYPAMAKREHQKNLIQVLVKSLKEAGLLKIFNFQFLISNEFLMTKFSNVKNILEREPELIKKIIPFLEKYERPDADLIAVTNGPGLEPCLWVGVNFAKVLSYFWNIPIVATNHIESHILVNFLERPKGYPEIKFPAVCLVVSGGHTQMILMKKIGGYKILGETRDDAAGECFDKCARILGLGYPGGPAISKLADRDPISIKNRDRVSIKLPRPMINTKDYDFSFSGLKTAVLYQTIKDGKKVKSKKYKQEMCVEIQQAIIDVLIKKTIKAAKDFKAKTIILGGGVSANSELRSQFELKVKSQKLKVKVFFPEKNLSTDNALMTAITGFYHQKNTQSWKKIEADGNLRIK